MGTRCECGDEVAGDTCFACGKSVKQAETAEIRYEASTTSEPAEAPRAAPRGDDTRLGRLAGHLLDITQSILIMDGSGNTIYDIPFGEAECTMRLGALRIKHGKKSISLRGSGAKAWKRAISYLQAPPVWYLRGSEDCEVFYGETVLGVTPCVLTPPFSWEAFERGSYDLYIQRPGAKAQKKTIPGAPGTHTIRFPAGQAAERSGHKPEGETLVLNPERTLVLGEAPCLTDSRGFLVLSMPGASAAVGVLKRGATITWDEPGLGRLSVAVKCDTKLKYDRLREMLPPRAAAPAEAPPKDREPPSHTPAEPEDMRVPAPPPAQLEAPAPPPPKKESWWSRRRKQKYNRGAYQGTNLRVTSTDLDTRLGRFDGYAFEAVMANMLAAMGWKIEKGYDYDSGRMLGPTKSDMGVDVLATKGKKRLVVQCKHWKEQCGGPDVSKTIGAASTNGGTSVLMICTGGFSTQAYQIVKESSMPVELWGWETIRKNLRRHLLK